MKHKKIHLNQKIFYVYVYLDPRKPGKYVYGDFQFDYEPFYVGSGQRKRYLSHAKDSVLHRDNSNPLKSHKILKIIKETSREQLVRLIVKIKKNLYLDDAQKLEIKLIQTIGRYDLKTGPLTNLTDGGEGHLNYPKFGKDNGMYGKKHSEKSKERMRKAKAEQLTIYNKLCKICGDKFVAKMWNALYCDICSDKYTHKNEIVNAQNNDERERLKLKYTKGRYLGINKHIRFGKDNPFFGKHHSNKTKASISQTKQEHPKRFNIICAICEKPFIAGTHNARICKDCKPKYRHKTELINATNIQELRLLPRYIKPQKLNQTSLLV